MSQTGSDAPSDSHRDPLSGAPGAHPVGVGIGAAAGGVAAGALAGSLAAGPVGAAIGAAVGALAGGLGGKAVAEAFDPTGVDEHWRGRFASEPYAEPGTTYDDYAPAYRLGAESRSRSPEASFDEAEERLATEYDRVRGRSRLDWDRARDAARASWNRPLSASAAAPGSGMGVASSSLAQETAMPDTPAPQPQVEASQTIDLNDEAQVDYWMERLGVTQEQLQEAVQAAGTSAKAVTDHLLNQGGSAGAS